MLALAVEQRDVRERVAVDDNQIGARAGGDDTQLTAAVQQLGIDDVDMLGQPVFQETGGKGPLLHASAAACHTAGEASMFPCADRPDRST